MLALFTEGLGAILSVCNNTFSLLGNVLLRFSSAWQLKKTILFPTRVDKSRNFFKILKSEPLQGSVSLNKYITASQTLRGLCFCFFFFFNLLSKCPLQLCLSSHGNCLLLVLIPKHHQSQWESRKKKNNISTISKIKAQCIVVELGKILSWYFYILYKERWSVRRKEFSGLETLTAFVYGSRIFVLFTKNRA